MVFLHLNAVLVTFEKYNSAAKHAEDGNQNDQRAPNVPSRKGKKPGSEM